MFCSAQIGSKQGGLLAPASQAEKSTFVNIREAIADGTSKLSFGGDHDGAFPL
jgi:hypothetical protein